MRYITNDGDQSPARHHASKHTYSSSSWIGPAILLLLPLPLGDNGGPIPIPAPPYPPLPFLGVPNPVPPGETMRDPGEAGSGWCRDGFKGRLP